MASKSEASVSETSMLGILLLLAAQCFTGGQFVSEEKILGGYSLDPLFVVGMELLGKLRFRNLASSFLKN